VDPQLYRTQSLMTLPAARMNELSAWLPDQWKQLQAARMAKSGRCAGFCFDELKDEVISRWLLLHA
jgi:hypothetical protein